MNYRTLLLSTAVAMLATSATAFEFTGGDATLRYTRWSEGGLSENNTDFGASARFTFGAGFGLETGLNYTDLGVADEDLKTLSMLGTYALSPALQLGLFYDTTWIMDDTIKYYGIEARYTRDNISLGGFWGQGDFPGGPGKPDVYGADIGYDMGNGFDFGLFYRAEDLSGAEFSEYGLSAGYQIAGISTQPVYLNAEYGRFDLFGSELDQFGISITVPFGNQGQKGRKPAHPHSLFMSILPLMFSGG
jgi:hypothetical protein